MELWWSLGGALGWLWVRNQLAINTLCGGFDVALGGFASGQSKIENAGISGKICCLLAGISAEAGFSILNAPSAAILGCGAAAPIHPW
jgi:hypothetical protein